MKKAVTLVTVSLLCAWLLSGCAATKPAEDQSAKLQEVKTSAEAATKELHDLRLEKAKLEADKSATP
ncbi:MAG: hypothetical protein V1913_02605 [Fibrobacterota bacterium]